MGTPQATLNDFITAAVNAYGGPNAPAMGVQWTPVTSAQLDALNSNSLGYHGEAWVNESTGEVMVANEGTVPTNTANLLSDTQLSVGAVPAAQDISNTFAQQAIVTAEQMLQGTGVSVTTVDLTGHSLGGYEGQGNTVFLSNLTNNGVQGFSGITYTNVSFDAPGIGGIDQSGVNTSLYTSYNFSAQGDIINLAGGDELQGTVDVSLPVGTPMWASGGLVVAGSTLSDTGVGSLIGGGLIALGLDNALDNHSSLLMQVGISPTVLGTTEVSQYAGLTPAQLQSLYGVPSAPTSPVYDAAGYNQQGYNQDGYNIFGVNVSGNLDPSIAADGGEVNTDTLSDGSTITVNIAANGSSTATLDEADGTVNTYTYNTSGQLTGATVVSTDGTTLTETVDPTTQQINYSESSPSGQVTASGSMQSDSDGGASESTITYNTSGQASNTDSDVVTGDGASTDTYTNYSDGAEQGQVVSDTSATGQVTSVSVTGTGNTSYDNGADITVAIDGVVAITGENNSVTSGSGATTTLLGDNNSVTATGGIINDSAADTGNTFDGDQTTINAGANFAGTVDGTDDAVYLTANSNSSLTLGGTDQSVFSTGNLTMTSAGTFAVITGANTIDLDGTDQSLTLETQGDTVEAITGDTDETLIGSDFTLNDTTGVFTGTVKGSNNTLGLDANSSSSVTLTGTGETMSSTGNDVTLDGTGTSATITGANTIDVGGASQSLTLETSGSTIDTSAGDTGEVLSGSGFTLDGAAGQFTGTVTGGGDVFDLDASSGSSLTLGGTNSSSDTVYASSDAVTLDGNTQVNVSGSHDTVIEAAGDSMGITGGGNTIDAGADELVWITNTGGVSDTVNASSDLAGGKTANGEATGIEITSNAQVNVAGSDNTISESAGDSLGITGGGNTIDAGADELVWITNTGGVADAVDASGDAAGGETANGQATGIEITSNAQVNVTGSSDSILESAGDSLGVTGGGNTIDAGADELVWVNGTNGTADTIDGSDITGGSTVNGEETGIWMAGSAQANISGSGDLVVETAGDSVGITGGGNTIDAGADELVWVNGTDGSADAIDGSNIAGGSMVNGQETGIWMADDAQADISGSHDLVAETTGDSVGITGGGNTIDAGADELVWVNGTDGTADIIDGSDIAGGSTVNGQETGIWMAGSAQATISGSDNLVAATTGDTVSITGGGNTIDAGADELVWVNGTNGVADTIDGSDITGGSIVNGQETGVWMADDAQVHIAGSGDDVTLDVGDTVSLSSSGDTVDLSSGETDDTIDGSGDTVIGADDQISLSGQNDTIDLSHATIDVSGDDHVTIDGSDDRIVGGSSDTFTVDGTDDDVSATDSSVTFDGSNAGDYVSGSGDSGSNWDGGDGDGDPGSGYGYGYGLTKVKGKNPTAAQIAAAEHSDSVYEGASWADKTITWSFASVSPGFSEAITNSQEQIEVEQAFQAWAKASGLKFEEVAAGKPADINVDFGDLNTASTNEIGLTTYKSQSGALEAGVQVQLEDPNETSLTTNGSGHLAYANTDATFEQVALHEIGHALGLADNDIAGSIMNGVLGTGNKTLDATDIANIQGLYSGAPTSSNGSVAALGMAQAHLLVQAMSLFDVTHMGIDNATSEASLMMYQERALASLHSSTHVA